MRIEVGPERLIGRTHAPQHVAQLLVNQLDAAAISFAPSCRRPPSARVEIATSGRAQTSQLPLSHPQASAATLGALPEVVEGRVLRRSRS